MQPARLFVFVSHLFFWFLRLFSAKKSIDRIDKIDKDFLGGPGACLQTKIKMKTKTKIFARNWTPSRRYDRFPLGATC